MRPHAQPVIERRELGAHHVVEFPAQLRFRQRDVPIPADERARGEKPAQIEVARPIAKPAPHLHERVIHL